MQLILVAALATFKLYFSHFIVLLVALQILNLGLFAQDFDIVKQHNGVELNIINSVTEYVAEVVMQKRNAFPEKKEKSNQSDHESLYKFQPFKIYASNVTQALPVLAIMRHNYGNFIVNSYRNHTTDITAPPPKSFFPSGNTMG